MLVSDVTTTILSLPALLDEITALEPIQELMATLRAHAGARLHIAPAPGSARAPLVAAMAGAMAAPVLYVVSTTDAALRACDDLRQWLGDDRVLIFPASDALPYEHMSTGGDILAARMRVLHRLAAHDADDSAPPVVVAPVRALMQPTLTPAELRAGSILLERGAPCVLDDLIERLINLGYRYAPTVEEPGEVNRRGGIIDVFPPGDDLPLRIEFFGDEIDSLRRFDPLTQRSEAQIGAAIIGPPHEVPLWRRDAALARMRDIDTSTLRREALDEWLQAFDHIRRGERFEGRALFAPFFRNEADAPATLLRHLPPGAIVAFHDALLLAQHAAELDHQAETRRRQQVDAGELPAAFPRPYLRWRELIAQVETLTLADFSNNEQPVWGVLLPDSPGEPSAGNSAESSGTSTAASADLTDERFRVHLLPEHLFLPADLFGGQIRRLVEDIVERLHKGERVVVVTPQAARLQELVAESAQHNTEPAIDLTLFTAIHGALDAGFRLPALRLTLYSDSDIFGWRQRRTTTERRRRRERSAEDRAAFLRGLKPGDYVVHIEHGIAAYEGLVRRSVGGVERDYLTCGMPKATDSMFRSIRSTAFHGMSAPVIPNRISPVWARRTGSAPNGKRALRCRTWPTN